MKHAAHVDHVVGGRTRARCERRAAASDRRRLLEHFHHLHPAEIDYSLDRINRLLADLGDPQSCLPPVIHVAGTNGKGSTIAIMRAVLEAAGKRVHVYTSPHLISFNERIELASGGPVSDRVLAQALRRCEHANQGRPITFFEATTAAAFDLFAREPADVVLLETGLGGRLDATNVVRRPAATVITSLSMDHESYLGRDIAQIAAEKAGILRSGVPLVLAWQANFRAQATVEAAARALGAPLTSAGVDFHGSSSGDRFLYSDASGSRAWPRPSLEGPHQVDNAATAIAALASCGMLPDDDVVSHALTKVRWPARLQRLTGAIQRALPDAACFVDSGHNPGAGHVLANAVPGLDGGPRTTLVVGMLAAKDAAGFLAPLRDVISETVTVPVVSDQYAREPDELAEIARSVGHEAQSARSLADAIETIGASGRGGQGRVLFAGSLWLAGEVLTLDKSLAPQASRQTKKERRSFA